MLAKPFSTLGMFVMFGGLCHAARHMESEVVTSSLHEIDSQMARAFIGGLSLTVTIELRSRQSTTCPEGLLLR